MPVGEYRSKQVVQALQIKPDNEAEIIAFVSGNGTPLMYNGKVTSVEIWTVNGPLSYGVDDWIVKFGDYNFDGLAAASFPDQYESISVGE